MIYGNHLLHGPKETIEAFEPEGYDRTHVLSSGVQAMVWIRSRTPDSAPPALPEGVVILGARYDEIFSNPAARTAYEAIVGAPEPFAVFAGCEEEMGL